MFLTRTINEGWQFSKEGDPGFIQVSLPHTPRLEPLEVTRPFQGTCYYKKELKIPHEAKDHRIAIEFEGVMQNCTVFFNGKKVAEHFGGYLPFTVDIQNFVNFEGSNLLEVTAVNTDDRTVPPGKPTSGLDFLYYGGIYRNVNLIVTPPVYFTDPVQANTVNGGGVLIQTKSLDAAGAQIHIKTTIGSICGGTKTAVVKLTVRDGETTVAETESTVAITRGTRTIETEMTVENAHPWSLDDPHLYILECSVECGNNLHLHNETFGIRQATVNQDGFFLNGKKIKLLGVNRHQQYPYIGIAASDNAQRREARLLKSMGINTVRLSHYPQSKAFLKECDKIGLLLIEPVPGWQYFSRGIFRKRLLENLRDMIRRDRNHPSVVIFEISPNESPMFLPGASDRFFHLLHLAAKEELPDCLTSGDTSGRKNVEIVDYDIPYTGEDKRSRKRVPFMGLRPTLTREYGDWAFGGNSSSSRVTRADGEVLQQIQAWNFQWDHNNNYLQHNLLGDLVWEGIDHNRGYYPKAPISTSGVLDIFRLPKFSFYFYQSQQNQTPVLFPALWHFKNKDRICVYSNCDEIKLAADGKEITVQKCDSGPTAAFDETKFKKTNDNYWMTNETHIEVSKDVSDLGRHTLSCLYDGGNCEKIDKPPFTFKNLSLDKYRKLTFTGYRNGKEILSKTIREPGVAAKLRIEVADWDVPLENKDNDFVFVYVHILDKKGTPVYEGDQTVRISVDGGEAIGHSEIKNLAGIAPFMVTAAPTATALSVTASADGLPSETVRLEL